MTITCRRVVPVVVGQTGYGWTVLVFFYYGSRQIALLSEG